MSDTLARLLKRALWFEALHETYPNRFTLWLFERAVERLRSERDHPKRPEYGFPGIGALGSIMGGMASAKAAAQAQANARKQHAYQQQLFNQGLQSQNALSQYANLLGYGSTGDMLNNAFQNRS